MIVGGVASTTVVLMVAALLERSGSNPEKETEAVFGISLEQHPVQPAVARINTSTLAPEFISPSGIDEPDVYEDQLAPPLVEYSGSINVPLKLSESTTLVAVAGPSFPTSIV